MINIQNKKNCCGCEACVQSCPNHCITMVEDDEGFLYPTIDAKSCINCGLCEKVCPVLNQLEPRKALSCFAAKNSKDEVRIKSSSGGVFSLFAEKVIDEKGVVFGARFNDKWEVVHEYATTKEDLVAFRGSKYVQSRIGDAYKQAREFLKQGRMVLFSGTPCQIAGLKHFLIKDYDNLLTIEVVCHGVPSPGIWREYLKILPAKRVAGKNTVLLSLRQMPEIAGISFRDKRNGWKKYGFAASFVADEGGDKNSVLPHKNKKKKIRDFYEPMSKNLYLQLFLKNLILRPSCFECSSRCLKSGSDITIGDYWGCGHHKSMDDNKGLSVVLLNTEKGAAVFNTIHCQAETTQYSWCFAANPCLERNVTEPVQRQMFWEIYNKEGLMATHAVVDALQTTTGERINRFFKRVINRLKIIIGIK